MPSSKPRRPKPPNPPPKVQPKQCATCIFRTDGNEVELNPGRLTEIQCYLAKGTPHECHTPQKLGQRKHIVCRGGRDFQLQIFHRMGLLDEPTDACLEAKMKELGIWC
jgi:hypothetical protein